jgi:type I restriction enzyme S subunit
VSWATAALGEIFEVARGGSPRPIEDYLTDDADGLNWVLIGDATVSGKTITETKKRIRREGLSKTRSVKPGDFILSNSMSFGRPYIMGISGCIHDGWLLLRPKSDKIYPDYFYYLLGSSGVYQHFASRAAGATVKNLNSEIVREVEVSFPPLDEQRRIATLLDQADDLRRKRRQAQVRFDGLAEAIFVKMFGSGQLRQTNVSRLDKYLTFVTSGGRDWSKYYSSIGTRFIRSLDVQMNSIGGDDIVFVDPPDNAEARRTRTQTGDVLLTITGSRIGRVASLPNELAGAYISQHVAILRVNSDAILPRYLSFFLSLGAGGQRQIAKAQYGQTKPGLNFEQIRDFLIPIPPIQQQEAFLRSLVSLDVSRGSLHRHATKLDNLFQSLQHRAFRGEL